MLNRRKYITVAIVDPEVLYQLMLLGNNQLIDIFPCIYNKLNVSITRTGI